MAKIVHPHIGQGLVIVLRKLGKYLKRFERGRRKFFEDVDKFNDRKDLPYSFGRRTGLPYSHDKKLGEKDEDDEEEDE